MATKPEVKLQNKTRLIADLSGPRKQKQLTTIYTGSAKLGSSNRGTSAKAELKGAGVQPVDKSGRMMPSDPLTIFYGKQDLGNKLMVQYSEALIAMFLCANGDSTLTLSAFLSSINVLGQITCDPAMVRSIERMGYAVTKVEVTGENMLQYLDVQSEYFLNRLKTVFQIVEWPDLDPSALILTTKEEPTLPDPMLIQSKSYAVYLGVMFACMIKQLNPNNYDTWLKKRFKAFNAKCGIQQDSDNIFKYSDSPVIRTCMGIQIGMSAMWEVRRDIFMVFKATSRDGDLWGSICNVLLKYARGAEMTHLMLINHYIVEMNPNVLGLPCMEHQTDALEAAFKGLEDLKLAEEDLAYARILKSESECAFMKSDQLQVFTALAISIGQVYSGSLSHYQGSGTLTQHTEDLVTYMMKFLEYTSEKAQEGDEAAREATRTSPAQQGVLSRMQKSIMNNEALLDETGLTIAGLASKDE